jgi:hypothetical protein
VGIPVQKYVVLLNIEKIQASLSTADGTSYTEAQVRQWLLDAGFEPHGNQWIVSEADLGQVDPSEVKEIAPLES